MFHSHDPNKCRDTFIKKLSGIYNTALPKNIKLKNLNDFWITEGLRKSFKKPKRF